MMITREDIKIARCEARGFYSYFEQNGTRFTIAYTRTLEEAERCIQTYLNGSRNKK